MAIMVERTDLQLQEEVATEIGWDARFTAGEVGVEIDQGVVTLRGTVSSYQKLIAAADIAAGVAGVKAVANDLVVRPPDQPERDDTAIARAVRQALEWDAEVPDERVQCVVRDGVVTLSGTVEHEHQHSAAVSAVARLQGVRQIIDRVSVERLWRPDEEIVGDLKANLLPRLRGAKLVGFRCRSGLVVLSGFVRSPEERLLAERVAWSVQGVSHVLNSIAVLRNEVAT